MPAGVSDRTRDTHSGKKRIQEGQRKVWREKATALCPWHGVSLWLTHSLREPTPVPVPSPSPAGGALPQLGDTLDKEAPAALRWGPLAVPHAPLALSSFLHTTAVRPEFQFSFHHQITVVFCLLSLSFLSCFEKDERKEEKAGQ